ncbi:MAG: hypothetical protein KC416_12915, partial [Myxococcales bacterium]|nr:hypothetical protein [Myxococcales bacterium]
MKHIAAILLALLAIGCLEDFDSATIISKNRVLGARIGVVGDEGRASPKAGEEVAIEWLVVDEEAPRRLSWAFLACAQGPTDSGQFYCIAEPFFVEIEPAPGNAAPALRFQVPPDIDRILVRGIICAEGTPDLDLEALSARCAGGDAMESSVILSVDVQEEGDTPNQNPSITGTTFKFATDEWDAVPAGTAVDCQTPPDEVPTAPRSKTDALIEIIPAAEPEEYTVPGTNGVGTRTVTEDLFFSHYVTAGEMDRQYSTIDPDD